MALLEATGFRGGLAKPRTELSGATGTLRIKTDTSTPARESGASGRDLLVLVLLQMLLAIGIPAKATSNYNAEDYVLAAGKFIDPSDNRDDLIAIARSPTGVSGLIEATPSGLGTVHQTWTAEHLGIPWPNGGVVPIVGNFNSPTDSRDDLFLQRSLPGLHYVSLIDTWYKLTAKNQTFSDSHLGVTWSQQSKRIVTGDFNGDGRADLFLQPRERAKASGVALASIDGKFVTGLSPTWSTDFGGLQWTVPESLVHAGDFNGDGRADLLVQANPQNVPIRMPAATPGIFYPVLTPTDRYVANANGIAWATGSTFSTTTTRWSRNDLNADWSPKHYVVHVGNFDKSVNSNLTDDVFLQPRRAGEPAYFVFFAACSGTACNFNRTVRTVEAPAGTPGWDWSTAAGNVIVGDFDGDGTADLYFQALTAAGTSQIVEVNASGSGAVSSSLATPTEPFLSEGGGQFNGQPGTAVGGTLGEFSVDPSGASRYNIPITVPPGVAGMVPDLALAYNSGGGNSYLSTGWALTGFSAISRCPKTFVQDAIASTGVADGVDLDSDDKWCLDGSRLKNVGGSSTEFRTEIESFQKVVASAAPGSETINWTVKDKSGLTRTYGAYSQETDGIVAAQGQSTIALTYLVKHIDDGFGNFIHFDYTQDTNTPGSYVPVRVKYGYGTSTTLAKVEFEYETRPDVQWGYLKGTKLSNNKRLNRILTYAGSRRVREYILAYKYSPSTNRSLLNTVTECERRNNTCLNATTFDWQTGARGFTQQKYYPSVTRDNLQVLDLDGNGINDYVMVPSGQSYWFTRFNAPNGIASPASGGLASSTSNYDALGTHFLTMDVNGDGFGDLLQHNPSGASLQVQTGYGGGPASNGGFNTAIRTSTFTLTKAVWDTSVGADVNGDGRDDLVYVDGATLYARLGTGVTATPISETAVSGVIAEVAGYGNCGPKNTDVSQVDNAYIRPIQFDSDGVADVLVVRQTHVRCGDAEVGFQNIASYALQVYSYNGNSSGDKFTKKFSSFERSDPAYWSYLRVIDANADGLGDVLFSKEDTSTGWQLLVSNGSTFTSGWNASGSKPIPQCYDSAAYFGALESTYDSASGCHDGSLGSVNVTFDGSRLKNAVILDYNHDGRTDILVDDDPDGGNWRALVSVLDSAGLPQYDVLAYNTGAARENYGRAFSLDVGGDGLPDVVSQGNDDEAWYVMHGRGPLPDLLNQVSNGLIAQSVQVQYSTTTDTGVYLGFESDMDGSGLAPAFPYAHATGVMPVVKKYLVPDANGNYISTFYTYRGATVHRQGYGFSGYSEVVAWNDNAATETRNRYLQSFPWAGMIASAQTRAPHASSAVLGQGGAASVLLTYATGCEGSGGNDQTPIASACWFMAPGAQAPPTVQPPFVTKMTVNTYGQKAGTAGATNTFPYLQQSVETTYALSNALPAPNAQPPILKITTADYRTADGTASSYDLYGNVGRILVSVTDGSGNNLHKTETQNWYTADNITTWKLGRLTSTWVQQTRTKYTDTTTAASAIRVSGFTYDNSTGLLLSETVEPATYGPAGTTSNPNGADLGQTKTYVYDAYGNRTSETHTGATIAGYGVASRQTLTPYGGSGNQFPTGTTNAENHQEAYTWDERFGVKTSLTGPNGLKTTWSYDGFGRPISEVSALSSVVTDTTYEWCGAGISCATGSKYKVITTSSGGARMVVEYDGLMREVFRTETAPTGTDLLQQRGYDPLGREFRVSLPYRSGDSPCWTLRTFDFQNRVVQEWSPGSSNSLTSNCTLATPPAYDSTAVKQPAGGRLKAMTYDEIDGSGHIKTTSNDTGRTVVRLTNVMDRLLQVTDAPSGGNISTVYDYDAYGNNTWVRDPDNSVTLVNYNARAFKLSMSDPNMGLINGANQGGWRYVTNTLGELVEQTDARGVKICQSYDKLGRIIQRIDGCNYAVGHSSRSVTNWTYDAAAGGIGKLYRVTGPFLTNGGGAQQTNPYEETYSYDSLGRPNQVVRLIDGKYFWSNVSFDDQGRIAQQVFPASEETATATYAGARRHTVLYNYNDRGALSVVKSAAGTEYWTLGGTDALGNVTSFTVGKSASLPTGMSRSRVYDPATGYMLENSASVGGTIVQFEDYQWSLRGNLTQRRDDAMVSGNSLTEDLEYDTYDRLVTVKVTAPSINGGTQVTYTNAYTNSGKLQSKGTSNGGSYTSYAYGTGNSYSAGDAGTHAVTSMVANGSARSYTYDNNGNMLTGAGRTISWTAANLPEQIIGLNGQTSTFSYGPDRARYRHFDAATVCGNCGCVPPTSTTLYVGDSFETISTNESNTTQYRHYIRAGSLTIAIHTEYSTGTGTTDHYLHHDHLGSVVAIAHSTGAIWDRYSYDPWGKRRRSAPTNAWLAVSPGELVANNQSNIQTRGFTGHEHLDQIGLIHMNGRVYDPELGRFISADSVIQFPESTQGLDRYAYVNNNPLSYTDPTGHLVWFVAAAIVGASLGAEYWVATVLIAGAAGYLETGTLRGALFSALSAGAAMGVGTLLANNGLALGAAYGSTGLVAIEAVAHGLTQGAIAAAQGEDFGAGFLSAAFAARFGGGGGGARTPGAVALRVVKAAVIGGTASVIGGGKFANGAATGAFVQAFNEELHREDLSAKELDVVGNPELDSFAVETLNSYPQKQPFELRTEVGYGPNGELLARPPTKLGAFGGSGQADMAGVAAVAHTHPHFTQAEAKALGVNMQAQNSYNHRGPDDHLVVQKFDVPNYFRTPSGNSIKVVERIDSHIRTRTVWTKP